MVEDRPHLLDHRQPRDVEDDLVGDGGLAGVGLRQLAAHHELRQLARGHVLREHGGDRAAGADHGDGVGDAEHLVELVADEQHGDALRGQFAERLEQVVDLLRHEYGGGLVEDEDAGASVEHLHDLDSLAVADAELGHEHFGLTGSP